MNVGQPSVRMEGQAVDGVRGVLIGLPRAAGGVRETFRVGDDLVIVLDDGRELLVRGFFAESPPALLVRDVQSGDLVALGVSEGGALLGVEPVAPGGLERMFGAEASHAVAAGASGVTLSTQDADGPPGTPGGGGDGGGGIGTPALVGGLLLLGAVAAAGGGGGGGGGSSPSPSPAPREPSGPPPGEGTGPYDYDGQGIGGVTSANRGNVDRVVAAWQDSAGSGTPSRADIQGLVDIVNRYVPEGGTVTEAVFGSVTLGIDLTGDGAADLEIAIETGAGFTPLSAEFDDDPASGDGVDRIEVYIRNLPGRATRTEFYDGASVDGSPERAVTDTFDSMGRLISNRREEDINDDGSFDRVVESVYRYFGGGRLDADRYTIYDDDADGTPDRLLLQTWRSVSPPSVAGVREIDLAGGDHTLEITDAVLTEWARAAGDHVLVVDGEAGDRIEIDSGISRITGDGATDSAGRHGYRGTNGRLYVDPDVQVVSFDLAELLRGIDPRLGASLSRDARSAAVEAFEAARVEGVTIDNLSAVFSILGGLDAAPRADLSRGQVGIFVDLADRHVPAGSAVEAAFGDRRVALDIDHDGDGAVDRSVLVTLDDSFNPVGAELNDDASADGSVERTETYTVDGAHRRTGALFDLDADGSADRAESYDHHPEGTRTVIRHDDDNDGTAERSEVHRYDGRGRVTRIEYNDDGQGAAERIHMLAYDADGREIRRERDIDGDGSVDRVETYTGFDGAGRPTGRALDLDADGTPDRGETWRYDSLGQLTRIEHDDDPSADDGAERAESRFYNDLGRLERLEAGGSAEVRHYDGLGRVSVVWIDGDPARADGPETVERRVYNDQGQLWRRELDHDLDGTPDLRATRTFDALGRIGEIAYDDNPAAGDGAERVERRGYDARGQLVRVEYDDDHDGTAFEADRIRVHTYTDGGLEATRRTETHGGGGGTADSVEEVAYTSTSTGRTATFRFDDDPEGGTFDPDRAELRMYSSGGRERAVVHDDEADGTYDRLVYTDGVHFTDRRDADGAAEIAGVSSVTLAGGGGSTRLTVTDYTLTALAGGHGGGTADAGYSFTIDGDGDDRVLIDLGIAATGGTDGAGRVEYEGSSGASFFVDPDVPVHRTLMAHILADPATIGQGHGSRELEIFRDAGLGHVTDENLAAVRGILGGTGRPGNLRDREVEALVDIVVEHVPDGAGVDAAFGAGSVTLDVDAAADGSVDGRLVVGLDAGFRQTRVEFDDVYDGTSYAADRIEVYTLDGRGNRLEALFDDDASGDGTFERVGTYTYDGRGRLATGRVESDTDGNGTADEVFEFSHRYLGASDHRFIRFDEDWNGTAFEADRTEWWSHSRDGREQFVVHDDEADGTYDRQVYVDDDYYTDSGEVSRAASLAGLREIHLAGGDDGVTVLRITVPTLEALAGGHGGGAVDAGYSLTIDGDANDRVHFGPGISRTGGTDERGRVEWEGPGGASVFVDHEVQVSRDWTGRILEEILQPGAVSLFEMAGVGGVTDGNLAAVRSVVGGGGRPPVRTLAELQALVNIAGEYVPVGAAVDEASYYAGTVTLTLDISGDGSADRRVVVGLDDGLRPRRAEFDDDYDGTAFSADRIEVYRLDPGAGRDRGGARTRTRFDDDASADGTFERTETYTYDDMGRLNTRRLDDKTADRVEYTTHRYVGHDRVETHTWIDEGGDGTADGAERAGHDGRGVRIWTLFGDDDAHVWTLFGDDGVRGWDRLVYEDDVDAAFRPTASTDLAGLSSIVLAGGAGATTVAITDAVLTAWADGAADYVLAVDGDANDRVELGAGIARIAGDGATDDGGRHGYQGTDGRVYVDPDVAVDLSAG